MIVTSTDFRELQHMSFQGSFILCMEHELLIRKVVPRRFALSCQEFFYFIGGVYD